MNRSLLSSGENTPAPARERLACVDCWIFDLDNTLYPASSDLWPRIDERITACVADLFGLDALSARALQKYYYREFGTTLRGLMTEAAIDAGEFLAFVHDVDRSSVVPDLRLAAAVAALPGRRYIMTNGSRAHALATARGLGIDGLFDEVFDIVAAGLAPKPDARAYDAMIARYSIDPARCAFFEDIARNLEVPRARGMATILVAPASGAPDHRETWESERLSAPWIDYTTSDLAGFLEGVVAPPVTSPGLSGASTPSRA